MKSKDHYVGQRAQHVKALLDAELEGHDGFLSRERAAAIAEQAWMLGFGIAAGDTIEVLQEAFREGLRKSLAKITDKDQP